MVEIKDSLDIVVDVIVIGETAIKIGTWVKKKYEVKEKEKPKAQQKKAKNKRPHKRHNRK